MEKEEKMTLRQLLSKDKIEEVIDTLLSSIEFEFESSLKEDTILKNLYHQILNLSSRTNELRQHQNARIISNENYHLEKNKIRQSVLQVIDDFPEVQKVNFSEESFDNYQFVKKIRKSLAARPFREYQFDFYICHDQSDSIAVRDIYNKLFSVGFSVFKSELIENLEWEETIKENIRLALLDSKVFILYGSEKTIKSDQARMEYDYFYKNIHRSDKEGRPFFLFSNESGIRQILPTFLEDIKPTNSIVNVVTDFLNGIKSKVIKTDFKENVDYQRRKEKAYIILSENVKEKNITKCPYCTFPLEKSEPNGWVAFFLWGISTSLLFFLSYQVLSIWLAILIGLVGGLVGWLILMILGNAIEEILNINLVSSPRECQNCKYLLKPNDQKTKYIKPGDREVEEIDSHSIFNERWRLSSEKKVSRVRKYFKSNDISGGLIVLREIFLESKDSLRANMVEKLIKEFDEYRTKLVANILSSEEYSFKMSLLISSALDLIEKHKEFISLVRKDIQRKKDFHSDLLSLSEILESVNCEKYLRPFIENGFNYSDFWILRRDDLESIDEISKGDIYKLSEAIFKEKQKIVQKAWVFVSFLVVLGSLFYGVTQFNFYNFEWSSLITGKALIEKMDLGNLSFSQIILTFIPLSDWIMAFNCVVFSVMLLVVILFARELIYGGKMTILFLYFSYIFIIFVGIPIFFLFLSYLLSIPISYYYFLQEAETFTGSYFKYFFHVFKIGFFIRLVPYVLGIIFFPKVYKRLIDNVM